MDSSGLERDGGPSQGSACDGVLAHGSPFLGMSYFPDLFITISGDFQPTGFLSLKPPASTKRESVVIILGGKSAHRGAAGARIPLSGKHQCQFDPDRRAD